MKGRLALRHELVLLQAELQALTAEQAAAAWEYYTILARLGSVAKLFSAYMDERLDASAWRHVAFVGRGA